MIGFEVQGEWIYARRRKALVTTPTAAKRIWVEDEPGNFYFVRADFGNWRKTLAEHNEVRETVAQLEAAGCVVENVPDWCRDPTAPLPVTVVSNQSSHPRFIRILIPLLGALSFAKAILDLVARHH